LKYTFTGNSPAFAVFSEIYYAKGWNAYLDDKPVPHYRVNYLMRGMPLPAGKHRIEFKFEPATYRRGEQISLGFNLALFALVLFGFWKGYRDFGKSFFPNTK
jgi:uncharacterized membrane protein YfhO